MPIYRSRASFFEEEIIEETGNLCFIGRTSIE
jgi:hypothetical protein